MVWVISLAVELELSLMRSRDVFTQMKRTGELPSLKLNVIRYYSILSIVGLDVLQRICSTSNVHHLVWHRGLETTTVFLILQTAPSSTPVSGMVLQDSWVVRNQPCSIPSLVCASIKIMFRDVKISTRLKSFCYIRRSWRRVKDLLKRFVNKFFPNLIYWKENNLFIYS